MRRIFISSKHFLKPWKKKKSQGLRSGEKGGWFKAGTDNLAYNRQQYILNGEGLSVRSQHDDDVTNMSLRALRIIVFFFFFFFFLGGGGGGGVAGGGAAILDFKKVRLSLNM